jgi:recombination protein RecT
MNQAVKNLPAQVDAKPLTIRDRLNQMTPEFKKALPGHIPAERFVRTIQTAVQMNPDIAEACGTVGGMQSLLAACTKAATDGLILDGREAALVTFNVKVSKKGEKDRWEKRVQYIPMVAGLMKKARNSGDVDLKPPQMVHANDQFEYDPTNDDAPKHKPDWFGDRGAPIGVYIVCRIKSSDETVVELMTRKQIMNIAGQSKNPNQYDPESGRNYEEWWRKTVIRRISKYLPSSSDRDAFMAAVSRIDEDFDFEAKDGGETVPAQPQQQRKQRGGAAAALKNVTPGQETQDRQEVEDYDRETGEIIDHENPAYGMDDASMQPGDDL